MLTVTGASAAVTVSDGDFSGWSADVSLVGGQTSTDLTVGGNPGPYRNVTTNTNAAVFTSHYDSTNVVDPGVVGEIASFDFTIDFRIQNAFGQGMSIGLLAIQDGTHFQLGQAGNTITGSTATGWQLRSVADATVLGTISGSGTLDTSASGNPITLGFYTGNSSGTGISIDYDNWSATANTIPEPMMASAIGGMVSAMLALCGRNGHHGADGCSG